MLTIFSFSNDIEFNKALDLLRSEDANIVEVRDEDCEIEIEWSNFDELHRLQSIITR